MKITKLIVLASLLAFTASAQYAVIPLTGVPTTIGLATSTNIAASDIIIDCSRQQNVALSLRFKGHVAGNSNVVYTLQKSLQRGSNYTTFATITAAANGTTAVDVSTNYNVAGIGYLKLVTVSSANDAAVITNQQVWYAIKKDSP